MDYKAELERMKEFQDTMKKGFDVKYWKPKEGQYKVVASSEIEESIPFDKDGKEPQERKQLHIIVDDKEYLWTFPLGVTTASVYGQLVHAATYRGKLKGESFTIVVSGEGKLRRFTVVL